MIGHEQSRRSRLRVAVLTNAVPAYRTPVFMALAADGAIDMRFFVSLPVEVSDVSARSCLSLRHSKGVNLRRRTVHKQASTENVEWLHVPVMLLFDLLFFRPDILITGEFGLRSLAAYFVARLRRVPMIIWSEEIHEHAAGISGLQRRLRSFLIPRANGFLAWGMPAVRYLRSWRVADERIYYCAQAVDNDYWSTHANDHDRKEMREELDVRGRMFLAVGRMMTRKGFDKLLLAWAAMPAEMREGNTLVFVGGGPDEYAIKSLARSCESLNVIFTGPQAPEQLGRYYAAADVFVFPSLLDVWGLVVNEAMACGLPVLASKYAGASQELVDDTGVGELFDPNNQDEFTAVLRRWCTEPPAINHAHIRAVVSKLNFGVTATAIRTMLAEQCGNLDKQSVTL